MVLTQKRITSVTLRADRAHKTSTRRDTTAFSGSIRSDMSWMRAQNGLEIRGHWQMGVVGNTVPSAWSLSSALKSNAPLRFDLVHDGWLR